MIKAIVCLIVLLCSLKAFSQSSVIPKDFLNPTVEISVSPYGNFEKLKVVSSYTSGRSEENPIIVEVSKDVFLREAVLYFRFHVTSINRAPHILLLNSALEVEDEFVGIRPFWGDVLVGGFTKKTMVPVLEKETICSYRLCSTLRLMSEGINVSFFLDEISHAGRTNAVPGFDRKALHFKLLLK